MDILQSKLCDGPPLQLNFIHFEKQTRTLGWSKCICRGSYWEATAPRYFPGPPHAFPVSYHPSSLSHMESNNYILQACVWFLMPCTSRWWTTVMVLLPPSTQSLNKALNEQLFSSSHCSSSFLQVILMDLSPWTKPWPSVWSSNYKCRKKLIAS